MKKELYLITFGVGHPCARFVQPVLAENDIVARGIACRYFGTLWSACYGPGAFERTRSGAWLVRRRAGDPGWLGAGDEVFPRHARLQTLDQEQETELYGEYWK